MLKMDSALLNRETVERHSVDMRQFIDFRQSTLPNGMRIIEAYNSSGLCFTLLPDRGLDIWAASYKGIPLTWISQGSPFPSDFGLSWLRQFNGGLLTTCGLTHVGPPESDESTGEYRDLHGRYSRLRAHEISLERHWYGSEDYSVWLTGIVSESSMFGEQLVLRRSVGLELGRPTITLWDTVTNVGDTPTPLMVLYHFNLGFPLIKAGTLLHTPNLAVYARDEPARLGLSRWWEYREAEARSQEQVYFHHLKAKSNGFTRIMIGDDQCAIVLDWDTTALPYFTQWKNARQAMYVSGIEPGNCIPEGRNSAQRSHRLMILEPGQEMRFAVSLTVAEGIEQMRECKASINQLQDLGTPVKACNLTDYQ